MLTWGDMSPVAASRLAQHPHICSCAWGTASSGILINVNVDSGSKSSVDRTKDQTAVVILLSSTYLQERRQPPSSCKLELILANINIKASSVNPWNISGFGI